MESFNYIAFPKQLILQAAPHMLLPNTNVAPLKKGRKKKDRKVKNTCS